MRVTDAKHFLMGVFPRCVGNSCKRSELMLLAKARKYMLEDKRHTTVPERVVGLICAKCGRTYVLDDMPLVEASVCLRCFVPFRMRSGLIIDFTTDFVITEHECENCSRSQIVVHFEEKPRR